MSWSVRSAVELLSDRHTLRAELTTEGGQSQVFPLLACIGAKHHVPRAVAAHPQPYRREAADQRQHADAREQSAAEGSHAIILPISVREEFAAQARVGKPVPRGMLSSAL